MSVAVGVADGGAVALDVGVYVQVGGGGVEVGVGVDEGVQVGKRVGLTVGEKNKVAVGLGCEVLLAGSVGETGASVAVGPGRVTEGAGVGDERAPRPPASPATSRPAQ